MEAVFVIAGVVGLIWGTVVLLRGGLLAGCLAVLFAGTCFSVPFFKIELGPVPLTVDRILLVLLVAQYIAWRRLAMCVTTGLSQSEIVFLAFIAMITLRAFTADWDANNYQPVSWLVVNYGMPAVMYWIARRVDFSDRAMRTLFGGLAIFGVYLAFTALAEYYKIWPLVFPKYIVETAAATDAEFVGRGRGPLLHPIANGILLAVCFGGALMWWPRLNRPRQLVLLLFIGLYLAAFYCSMTRSVWMGAALALTLAIGLPLPWNWRIPLLGGGLLIVVAITLVQWENLVAFKRDEALSAEKTAESVELRPILATIAWHMFLDRPLFGCGYAQYRTEHLAYTSDRSTGLDLSRGRGYIQHNVFLSLLAETGLIGLGLFLATLFVWTRDAWRLWSDAAAPLGLRQQGLLMMIALGAYCINGMFHEVSVIPMANMTLFFLAGVTTGSRRVLAGSPSTS
jgi:O-antigen ligase